MQDEVNEKVVSLAIKTSKLTAEVLQKAMKALLAKGKGQLTKAPHGKITYMETRQRIRRTQLVVLPVGKFRWERGFAWKDGPTSS